jgi:hypothetical protein
MILTYKYKHNRNFLKELSIAKRMAVYAFSLYKKTGKQPTSKDLKAYNLPSTIKWGGFTPIVRP